MRLALFFGIIIYYYNISPPEAKNSPTDRSCNGRCLQPLLSDLECDIMNAKHAVNIDAVAEETVKELDLSRKSPKLKTIVVHPQLYQRLVLGKGTLTIDWAQPGQRPEGAPTIPTFADVIVNWHNEGLHFGQLMRRIIRQHPELKTIIAEAAKQNPKHYKLVKGMLNTVGNTKTTQT